MLNGNWEEKYVTGSRIEIDGDRLVILWQGDPVLETRFSTAAEPDGRIRLLPEHSGLRYRMSDRDYASVTELYYQDGRLHYIQDFPISGRSETIMDPTDKSRYGNVDIRDDLLTEVQGTWKDDSGYYRLHFDGDKLTINQTRTIPVHAAVERSAYRQEDFRIIDQDPAHHGIAEFDRITADKGILKAALFICDAGTHEIVFTKK